MQLSVNGRHLDIGDALRSHIEESLTTIFGKYFGDAIDARVTMSQNNHLYHAQVNVHVGRGLHLAAEAEADRIYAAFDAAADRIAKRLRRYKRRLRDEKKHAQTPLEVVEGRHYVLASADETADADDAALGATGADTAVNGADTQPAVVAEMSYDIPSLSVSEAVMRLDLADVPAMMFRNAAHGGLNMIYRRADGNVGWVDPEGNTVADDATAAPDVRDNRG
ncbi:ribosome hibernation-promoting factor, HPF/YfiA family [Rhodovibrio salinarum]|uniref:Ribosome hibernation promoting factor n=1 Tax=Rhodovibrio salinarum TaxID=1087 RepID=A0A934V1K0_9PROT|nr:ribosome-associated translation inhibitor RaiA [Rhodovibrio salinarum]MBK1698803.1 ribosomal subunit interface protein [Rhodovibrio salinarum]